MGMNYGRKRSELPPGLTLYALLHRMTHYLDRILLSNTVHRIEASAYQQDAMKGLGIEYPRLLIEFTSNFVHIVMLTKH